MILPESLTYKWIEQVSSHYRNADKILIEKAIRALYLLELLKTNGLDFIFKGGTSLTLTLPEIKRLSIDIDIIITGKHDNLEEIFKKVIAGSDFISFIEQARDSKIKIEKAHYKFFYTPVTKTRAKEEYILLDILFETNPYNGLISEIPIANSFLKSSGKDVKVLIPSLEAILGDKLTAYAPNTSGVPYNIEKEIEIIKQLYDIASLFDVINNVEDVRKTFIFIAERELGYREIKCSTVDVLDDIIQTSLCISLRGQDGKGNFEELQRGITNIINFIISEKFHLEKAIKCSSKAAYLAVLLKSGENKFTRFSNPEEIKELLIDSPHNNKLNRLKKSDPEAFFYWYHATQLLSK